MLGSCSNLGHNNESGCPFMCWADAEEEMGSIKMRCQELLHDPKCQQKLVDVWGSGAGLVLDETRAAMGRILKVWVYITPAPSI